MPVRGDGTRSGNTASCVLELRVQSRDPEPEAVCGKAGQRKRVTPAWGQAGIGLDCARVGQEAGRHTGGIHTETPGEVFPSPPFVPGLRNREGLRAFGGG